VECWWNARAECTSSEKLVSADHKNIGTPNPIMPLARMNRHFPRPPQSLTLLRLPSRITQHPEFSKALEYGIAAGVEGFVERAHFGLPFRIR